MFGTLQNVLIGLACFLSLLACDGGKPAGKVASGDKIERRLAFPLAGEVKEVHHGGGYTYVLIADGKQETWVAVPQTEVSQGEKVSVALGQMMRDFPSKTLNRTFPELVFASGLDGKVPVGPPQAPAAPAGGGKADHFGTALEQEAGSAAAPLGDESMGSAKAVVPFADLKVTKASGANAFTVGELFAKSATLNGKKVRIRAQVVKYSAGIMGKNWLHLQDGSGDPAKNTHDLVVTTTEEAKKGEVLTVEGTLAAHKDFGFGYKYEVIVEDVVISR